MAKIYNEKVKKDVFSKKKKENIYLKNKNYIEKQIDKQPTFYAFDKKQLEEGKKKLGVKDNSELYSIGYGGFIKKKDFPKYEKMWQDINKKEKELMKNDDYLYQGFKYEMANHEYSYTYEPEDTLRVFGKKSLDDLTPRERKIWDKAEKDYLKTTTNY